MDIRTEESKDALMVVVSPNGQYVAYIVPLDGVNTVCV